MTASPQLINQVRLALERSQPVSEVLKPYLAGRDAAETAYTLLGRLRYAEVKQVLAQISGREDPVSRLLLAKIKDFLEPAALIDAYAQANWCDDLLENLVDAGDQEGLARVLSIIPRQGAKFHAFVSRVCSDSSLLATAMAAGIGLADLIFALNQIRVTSPQNLQLASRLLTALSPAQSPELEAAIADRPAVWAQLVQSERAAEDARERLARQHVVLSSVSKTRTWDAP